MKAAVTEAVTADLDRFVTNATAAWGVPGKVLALVEAAARDAANRIGQALIQLPCRCLSVRRGRLWPATGGIG